MRFIIFERQRIGDPATGKGQSGLFLEEWEAFDLPKTEPVIAAREETGLE